MLSWLVWYQFCKSRLKILWLVCKSRFCILLYIIIIYENLQKYIMVEISQWLAWQEICASETQVNILHHHQPLLIIEKQSSGEEKIMDCGKQANIHARLKSNPSCQALPFILLFNVSSLYNKPGFFRLFQSELRECCIFVLMETWINDNILDAAIQLARLTTHCTNRIAALSVTEIHGGCLDFYTNNGDVNVQMYKVQDQRK